jgi:hypothetical protein
MLLIDLVGTRSKGVLGLPFFMVWLLLQLQFPFPFPFEFGALKVGSLCLKDFSSCC